MTLQRPVPRLTEENRFFWTSGADGRLRFMRCNDCQTTIHPPYPICRHCLSENVTPQAVPGTGGIYNFTLNHPKRNPAFGGPLFLSRGAIHGAPRALLATQIVGGSGESGEIGDRAR